ncbi:MAG: UDP-N-acetylmuramoyl-L-alanyl-D-glutamate--2,6-diaminopimelate ligase [Gemmatimonadota bacterium]|nr:UDP-N-acetylmuramoyl-L-alanyl-D-glutamate--2,6-diaminopimelate ligase [Gemmatimonadota bacterium]
MIPTTEIDRRLEACGLGGGWSGRPPAAFAALRTDSRRVESGDLFCAIRGLRFDGHEFLDEAARCGAAATVVERRPAGPPALPLRLVADTHAAAAHLAALFAGDPARELHVVGVTGTNGKTTTALLVRHILSAAGPAAALGTLGAVGPDGRSSPGRLTTPGPEELAARLAAARDVGARFLAMEVSSHALVQKRVEAIPFACAVFTNLTRDHLDYHGDMGAYRAAKLRLLDLLAADGACAWNADDPAWGDLRTAAPRSYGYGMSNGADVRAVGVRLGPRGSRWQLVTPKGESQVELPLLGAFNVSNALAAAAAAHAAGLATEEIARALATAPQVPGRMEVLASRPALVVRDYAHTPDALERALETMRPLVAGRLVCVFGCGGDRDPGKRPLMGQIACAGADLSLVTSDNPRTEDPAEIVRQVVAGLEPGGWEVIVDRREAIDRALAIAGPGDAVLLAGKGHETTQDIDGVRHPFDEARIVSDVLERAGSAR